MYYFQASQILAFKATLSLSFSLSLFLSFYLLCCRRGVPQGQTESGGIVLADICWATSAQRRCHPQEALYLPTFSHLLIVNKLLSLSLSLSLSVLTDLQSLLDCQLTLSLPLWTSVLLLSIFGARSGEPCSASQQRVANLDTSGTSRSHRQSQSTKAGSGGAERRGYIDIK
jgi:hypothetical protein